MAAHRHKTVAQPFADRFCHLGHAQCTIDTGGRAHLIGPAQARLPALVDELLRGGGERIRHRIPDVAAAVTIEIDSVLVEFGWEELRETGGAGPGRAHILARHFAIANDLQRQNELGAVLILAAADIGLRRQHPHRIVGQRVAAIVGFAAPDRQYHGGGHAETRFDRAQGVAMLRHQPLPFLRQPRNAGFLDVVSRHLHELGLRWRAGRGTSRQDQVWQFVIRLKTAGLGIESRARHPGGLRFRPQRGDELGEAGVAGAGGGRHSQDSKEHERA